MTELPSTSSNSDQYAQQWIDFLRKRNTMLSGLLLLSIILTLFSSLAAFYFHQQSQTAMLEATLSQQGHTKLKTTVDEQKSLIAESNRSYEEVKASYEKLSEEHLTQTNRLREAESALAVNQEIVDNLNSQISLVKEENAALSESLSQVRQSLLSGASNKEVLAGENKRLTKEIEKLTQKLKDRKVAYLAVVKRQKETRYEIDELVNANDKLRRDTDASAKRVESLRQRVASLNDTNSNLKGSLDKVKRDYQALEEKFASMMAPIGAQLEQKPMPNQDSASLQEVETDREFDGLEEIQLQQARPVVRMIEPQQTEASSGSNKPVSGDAFDYDKISLP